MNPGKNPMDPFNLLAGGPFAAWQQSLQMSLRMLEVWQRAWAPLMQPMLGTRAPFANLPAFGSGMFPGMPKSIGNVFPFGAFLPRVEASVTPMRGPGGEEAARVSMRVQVPAVPGVGGEERVAIEALIAREQGRGNPKLGCLEGVQVVYPDAQIKPQVVETEPVSVTRKVATRTKSAKTPVVAITAQKVKATPTKTAIPKPVAAKAGTTGKAAPKAAGKAEAAKVAAKVTAKSAANGAAASKPKARRNTP